MKRNFLHKSAALAMLLAGGYSGNTWAAPMPSGVNMTATAADDEGSEAGVQVRVGGEDGTVYSSFDDAVAAANEARAVVTLLTDATSEKTRGEGYQIELNGCKGVDLNGHKLTIKTNFKIVDGNETVVFSDSRGNGEIVGDFGNNTISMFYNATSATLILKGGTFKPGGQNPGFVYSDYEDFSGKLIIYGGTFYLESARRPFSIHETGTMEVFGGKFSSTNFWKNYVNGSYKIITTDDGMSRVVRSDKVTLSYGTDGDDYLQTFEKGLLIDTNESSADYSTWLSKMTIGEDLADVNVTLKRNFANGKWNALYLPYAVTATADMLADFDVAEAWDTELVDGATTIEFKTLKEGESIPSYTPMLVRPRNGATEFTATSTAIEATPKAASDCSTFKQKFTFYGVLENTLLKANHGYYLDASEGAMMYASDDEAYLTPFKFYMTIQDRATGAYVDPTATQSRVAMRVVDGETTGVKGVSGNSTKTADRRVFNMQGALVGTSTTGLPKGIYVQNGRKVVVK